MSRGWACFTACANAVVGHRTFRYTAHCTWKFQSSHLTTSLPCSHFEVWPASTLKSSVGLTWVPKVHRARLEQARTAFGTLSAFARVQALARASALSAGGHHFTMNSGLSRLKYSLVVMADLPALRRGEQLRDVQKLFYESEFDFWRVQRPTGQRPAGFKQTKTQTDIYT